MTGEQSFLFCFHLNKSFFNNVGLKKAFDTLCACGNPDGLIIS